MKRRLDWRALPGIIITLIMIIFGIIYFILPALNRERFVPTSLILPIIWTIIVLLVGIRTLRRFLRLSGSTRWRSDVLSNLYGPRTQRSYLEGMKSRYSKDEENDSDLDISESLYQLELMRLDGTISEEEFQFVKADLMKKQKDDK